MAGKSRNAGKLFIDNFDKYTDTPAGAALVRLVRSCNDLKLENIYPVSYKSKTGGTFASRFIYPSFVVPAPALPALAARREWKARPARCAKLQHAVMVIHDTLHNRQPYPVPLMVRALSPRTNGWNRCYVVPAQYPDRHLLPGTRRDSLRAAADFDPAIAVTGGVDHLFATARLIDSGCIFTSMLPGKAQFQFPAHSHFRQQ